MTRAIPFAIGFALMVAYWPDFSGLATTPRWDVGVLMAGALMIGPAGRMSAPHFIGLALVAWLIVTLAWSSGQAYGTDTAAKLIVVTVAFAWGAALRDPVPFIAGAAVGLAISSLIVIPQWFGWRGIDFQTGSPAGLFWNANRLAEVSVLVLAGCLARRLWWALPGLVPAIVAPYSRGAWLTAAIVVAVWAWQRSGLFVRLVSLAIVGWVGLFCAMTATLWRTELFGLDALAERLAIWSYTVANLDLLGHGLGSFAADAPLIVWGENVSHPIHPHNEWLWVAYEGGLPAVGILGAFAVLVWRSGVGDGSERRAGGLRLVLIAVGCVSLFAMPFHDPATVLFAAVVAGNVARRGERVRVAADGSRDPLRTWGDGYGDRREPGRVAGGAEALSVR